MEARVESPPSKRAVGEWLFQLTTITIGVLIALDAHVATFAERTAKLDRALRLITELEAGTEPTVHEVDLGVAFPSLSEAGWQTAERRVLSRGWNTRTSKSLHANNSAQQSRAASLRRANLAGGRTATFARYSSLAARET